MNIMNELYILFYLVLFQFKSIFPYWVLGIVAGSAISVFATARINNALTELSKKRLGLIAVTFSALLGAASPMCMYGTVPLIASFGRKGVPQYLLAAFMISSILLNPNLFIFSFALGTPIALLRLFVCIAAGVLAGVLTKSCLKDKALFDFRGFEEKPKCRGQAVSIKAFLASLNRGIVKTAPYFLAGILLTALFDRYVQDDWLLMALGQNTRLGVLLAASLGVPVYICGGGTIPLLKTAIDGGMSIGAAVAFMVTGPATKITNLSAVKAILGIRNFIIYISFNITFAVVTGLLTDMCLLLMNK